MTVKNQLANTNTRLGGIEGDLYAISKDLHRIANALDAIAAAASLALKPLRVFGVKS